jgi:hypothetical protein
VSEALASSKRYYSKMEKICYDIVMSTRRLHHYFEAHRVRVLTNQPLNDIFGNKDSSGRISKWVMELSEYFITHRTELANYNKGTIPESPWQVYHDGA